MRSDEELMVAYVAGDHLAFEEIVSRHAGLVSRIVGRYAGTEQDARDLVQQTFLNLHRARHDFRPGARLRPWLATIAANLAREHDRADDKSTLASGHPLVGPYRLDDESAGSAM